MEPKSVQSIIAVTCNPLGQVQTVVRDDLNITADCIGRHISTILDPASVTKSVRMLDELLATQVVTNWEMNVRIAPDKALTLFFTGAQTGGDMLIVGTTGADGVEFVLDELTRLNNEQANVLRRAIGDQIRQARSTVAQVTSAYDELTKLNNELVTLQRELMKKNVELGRLNEQKNQFLGMAAHDLRNPLGVIMAYSQFLLDEASTKLDEEQVGFVKSIKSSSEFMLRLVNDFLDVSKIEAGKLELDLQLTDINSLGQQILALNKAMADRKQIRLEYVADEKLPQVKVDPSKLQQVLNNLITNALKYCPANTIVTIGTRHSRAELILYVKDQGPGIPLEALDRIFQPYTTAGARTTGGEKSTGLGLVIARRIVEGHRGRIWVESEVGKGTTFLVSLPLVEPLSQPDGAAPR